MESIKQYEEACNNILHDFCEKQGFDFEDARDNWVSANIGGICQCGDFFISLDDMLTDLRQNAPNDEYLKYYDYCVECESVGLKTMNYYSWLKGCPRYSQEFIAHIAELKSNVEFAENELEKAIKEAKLEW